VATDSRHDVEPSVPASSDALRASAPPPDGGARSRGAARDKLLLRQGEVAQLLGISERELRRWRDRGFAPAPIAAHGGRPLWSRDSIFRFVSDLSQRAQRRGGAR